MDKIDRLGWAAGMSFLSYGVRIGVRTNDPALLPQLSDYLPPRWTPLPTQVVPQLYSILVGKTRPGSGIHQYNLLYDGAVRVARSLHLNDILDSLQSTLHLHVATKAPYALFVHAGVVAWEGAAILIPGRSFSGKSSLVSALVEAGAEYLSDEYAVLDGLGHVFPYPKPIHLRGRQNGGRGVSLHASSHPTDQALPVALIVVTKFQEGTPWRPRLLSRAEALLALLSNTVQARRQPRKVLTILSQVVNVARSIKSKRGEARDVVPFLLDEVRSFQSAPFTPFPAISREKENLYAASVSKG